MNKLEITDKSLIIELASDWDELDQEQVIKILALVCKLNAGLITSTRFTIECFYVIAKIQRNWISIIKERRLSKKKRMIKFAGILQMAKELTAFLFVDPESDQLQFSYQTVRNFFPVIKTYNQKFFGPRDLLIDLTFGEFRSAIESMRGYFASKHESDLNDFVACLYRPAIKASSKPKREKYNPDLSEIYANEIQSVAFHIKTGILLWFTTCIQYIQTNDLTINNREISLKPLFPEKVKGEKEQPGLGWTGILYGIAKDQVFGDIDKVEERNLFDILLYMYDNHLKNEQLKKHNQKK